MIHPLFRLLASEPGKLVEHAGAYAELARAETAGNVRGVGRRLACLAAAVLLGGTAVGLAGMAVLLAATIPLQQMPLPAALWLVPAVPALAAVLCAWVARRPMPGRWLPTVRAQWQADLALLRQLERQP
ncbi:phage holin family protein [Pseudaquabacterium rugosum]|jgi:hypothetical protein|uniref:Phage holin family protein n=1 Tax=Pseudaquabacterium rugosum TaxID=2984194 RepID=A0ABU9BAQ7_9BURK